MHTVRQTQIIQMVEGHTNTGYCYIYVACRSSLDLLVNPTIGIPSGLVLFCSANLTCRQLASLWLKCRDRTHEEKQKSHKNVEYYRKIYVSSADIILRKKHVLVHLQCENLQKPCSTGMRFFTLLQLLQQMLQSLPKVLKYTVTVKKPIYLQSVQTSVCRLLHQVLQNFDINTFLLGLSIMLMTFDNRCHFVLFVLHSPSTCLCFKHIWACSLCYSAALHELTCHRMLPQSKSNWCKTQD
ncbi:hypothetical protein ILYODFUR_012091 [Ilyodon furcidens]|uniref:Uncharacterized protein n=1 Tax=Ilyodon furcidens TaxID=33524 RepID=A0ABV0U5D5_9TELE